MDPVLLAEEALKLAPIDRAQLIDVLWRSLDADDRAAVDRAWAGEARARLDAYRAGKLEASDDADALNQIEREMRA